MEETSIIRETLEEELARNERSQHVYEREIARLPRGSVTVRTRRGRQYCYLKYRDGAKVVTDYVGLECSVGDDLRRQIAKRQSLQESLRRLKREHAFIVRALGRASYEA